MIDVFHVVMGLSDDKIRLNSLRVTSGFVFSKHSIISFEIPSIPGDLHGLNIYDAFSNSSDVISKSRHPVVTGLSGMSILSAVVKRDLKWCIHLPPAIDFLKMFSFGFSFSLFKNFQNRRESLLLEFI